MHVAALLGGTFERSLVVISMIFIVHLALIVVVRLIIASGVAIVIVLPTVVCSFVGDALKLVVIARLKLVAVIMMSCLTDLVVTLLVKCSVDNSHIVNTFEVLCKAHEYFVNKSVSALDVLRAIRLLKAKVKSLNLQIRVGGCEVSLGKEFRI